MGLDAVVYRNIRNIELGNDKTLARLVPETGEVCFDSDEISIKFLHERHAAEHRLGNIAEIGALRQEIGRLIGAQSLIASKMLYSGTHAGDFIPLQSLSALSAELKSIRKRQPSPGLSRFVASVEELVRAAKDEGNPIVFV